MEKPDPEGYQLFAMTDPAPYMDQLIRTAGIMVKRTGGTSVEFVVNSIIQASKNPNCMILAACPKPATDRLAAWMGCTFVPDTYQPWVEIWGLWVRPGLGELMRELGMPIVLDWARWKGAIRIVAIITRNRRSYRKFFDVAKFEPVGIVIERRL